MRGDKERCERCGRWVEQCTLYTVDDKCNHPHAVDVAICQRCYKKYSSDEWGVWLDHRFGNEVTISSEQKDWTGTTFVDENGAFEVASPYPFVGIEGQEWKVIRLPSREPVDFLVSDLHIEYAVSHPPNYEAGYFENLCCED